MGSVEDVDICNFFLVDTRGDLWEFNCESQNLEPKTYAHDKQIRLKSCAKVEAGCVSITEDRRIFDCNSGDVFCPEYTNVKQVTLGDESMYLLMKSGLLLKSTWSGFSEGKAIVMRRDIKSIIDHRHHRPKGIYVITKDSEVVLINDTFMGTCSLKGFDVVKIIGKYIISDKGIYMIEYPKIIPIKDPLPGIAYIVEFLGHMVALDDNGKLYITKHFFKNWDSMEELNEQGYWVTLLKSSCSCHNVVVDKFGNSYYLKNKNGRIGLAKTNLDNHFFIPNPSRLKSTNTFF